MKYLVVLVWLLLSSCVITAPNFQTVNDTCSSIVESALRITDQLCAGTVPDQVCYGNSLLDIEPQPGFGPFKFDQAGDIVMTDSTHFTVLFGVSESISNFWRNLARMK